MTKRAEETLADRQQRLAAAAATAKTALETAQREVDDLKRQRDAECDDPTAFARFAGALEAARVRFAARRVEHDEVARQLADVTREIDLRNEGGTRR